MQKQLSIEYLKDAHIPERYWQLGRDNFHGNPAAMDQCVRFIKAYGTLDGLGLLLHGPLNCGTTFLGVFVLKCLMSRGVTCDYTTLWEVSQVYLGDGRPLLSRFGRDVEVLFIDELETPQQHERNSLQRVLQFRTANKLTTLLASRLKPSEYDEHFSPTTSILLPAYFQEVPCEDASASFVTETLHETRRAKLGGGHAD